MDFDLPEEMKLFRATVRDWVEREAPKAWARELEAREADYPFELWEKMTRAGFHGLAVPEEYGGQGGDLLAQVELGRGLARSLGGLTWVWAITSFAGARAITMMGREEQRERFLPAIARGELRFSIGFTEPGGGTDVLGALRTSARRVDGGWVLSGNKTWCSSAHVADYVLLLARTTHGEAKAHRGLSLFLLPTAAQGVSIHPLAKLGMRAIGASDVGLDDVFVEDALLLGAADEAWYALLPTLNTERTLVASFCLGILDGVLEDALAYVRDRQAFGRAIGEFQILQHYIADIAMQRAQVELMVYHAAWLQSLDRPAHLETTMTKVVASEAAVSAADRGIQILGGMGYSAETDMQRYWRDARLWPIGPITNEMARNVIAEQLGLPRSF
ncbi:MAG TPA: acyl-CoA dehydrogenase family protein [Solirubrobacteraceae bacterium]|nr:acyl-CoA dehydrogenase family protein [Solirubrobacteraceae bacterium]